MATDYGAIAQLGERLLCKQEVTGSIPVGSTSLRWSFRLLFKNSEEARRVQPSSNGWTHWVRDCISSTRAWFLVGTAISPSAKRITCDGAPRSKGTVLTVIGSSEQVHVVDALAITGDEGRCSLR